MTTKIINTGSNPTLLIIILLAVAIGGYILYQQGAFDKHTDININLPGGKSISGTIKE